MVEKKVGPQTMGGKSGDVGLAEVLTEVVSVVTCQFFWARIDEVIIIHVVWLCSEDTTSLNPTHTKIPQSSQFACIKLPKMVACLSNFN